MISIKVNGASLNLESSLSIEQLITQLKLPPAGVALALNGVVVPKARWSENWIETGDQLDIFQPIAGG